MLKTYQTTDRLKSRSSPETMLCFVKVDRQGNVYCTDPGGIWVVKPDGRCLGRVMMREQPANLAWGDRDWKTLYITARASIYRLTVQVQGIATLQLVEAEKNKN